VTTLLEGLVYADPEIAVVTHAGPIRAVHAWVEGLNPQVFPTLPLGFGQVVSVDWARVRAAVAGCEPAAGSWT
jgi:broad specificity phosphatase PhoE